MPKRASDFKAHHHDESLALTLQGTMYPSQNASEYLPEDNGEGGKKAIDKTF
jgi:hypothetical protein